MRLKNHAFCSRFFYSTVSLIFLFLVELYQTMRIMMVNSWCLFVAITLVVAPGGSSAWAPSNPARGVLLTATTIPQHQQRYVTESFPLNSSDEAIEEVDTPQVEQDFFTPAVLEPDASASKNLVKSRFSMEKSTVQMAATMVVATSLTFVLNNAASMGPIRASSVTAMLATMVLPENLALVALCGSFSGMARTAVIPGFLASLLLGGTSAAMMAQFNRRKWLVGVGGRLGFIAQCACTLQFIVQALVIVPPSSVGLIGPYPSLGKLLKPLPSVAFFTVAGAFFMSFWKDKLGQRAKNPKNSEMQKNLYSRISNSVGAVGATGLIAALVLPVSAAGPAFCGSFIAMSAPAKLPTYGALLGASIMGGICQQSLAGALLGGWGGKLGTAALMGTLSYMALANVIERIGTKTDESIVPSDTVVAESIAQPNAVEGIDSISDEIVAPTSDIVVGESRAEPASTQ